MLQLPAFSQSGTKAGYDPLPVNEPGDEQLPLYNVGAYANDPPVVSRQRALSCPLPTTRYPLHDVEEDSNQPRTDVDSTDTRRPSSTSPAIVHTRLGNFVWYMLHGLCFAIIGTISVFVCGGISTGLGLLFLHAFDPYKTVFFTPEDGLSTLGRSFWACLLGSGICGVYVGLLSSFCFMVLLHHPDPIEGLDEAERKTKITQGCVCIAIWLGPVAGLFAAAVGVAQAPAWDIRLPEQCTAMHALGATFCGMLPFPVVLLLNTKF